MERLTKAKAGQRLRQEGQVRDGIEISVNGERTRIDLKRYSRGEPVTVYA